MNTKNEMKAKFKRGDYIVYDGPFAAFKGERIVKTLYKVIKVSGKIGNQHYELDVLKHFAEPLGGGTGVKPGTLGVYDPFVKWFDIYARPATKAELVLYAPKT